jgi:hypothetical protein
VGAVAVAVAAVEAVAVAALPAVEAAVVVVGSPGVVLLLPEASLAAGPVVLPAVVAPVLEARQGLEAVAPVPAARAASVR